MSPNKLLELYLRRVCRHLLWPPYRARVRRELTDHIFSRARMLSRQNGLTQTQAVRQTLRALGDPDELGKALRHARLPTLRVVYNAASVLLWIAIIACAVFLAVHLLFSY